MKETFYFSHDYNARNDGKLVKVMMKHGVAGIGVYWCIVEMLYEEGGYLNIEEYERITFELRTSENVVKDVIENFGLFASDDTEFWSDSVLSRLKERQEKSDKARESIQKRWKKREEENTNVLRTQNDSNTIKERKGKESKVKERKENTETDTIVSSQAIVNVDNKLDKRNQGTQRIIDIIKNAVQIEGFLYDNNKEERNRATIIAKRQSDWGLFVKEAPEEQEEQLIRAIISYSNQNEYSAKIRSCKDFHEKWKKVANSMKQLNKKEQEISDIPTY